MYILQSIFCFAVALIPAGFLYQRIGARRERRRYASPGRWVDLEGIRRLPDQIGTKDFRNSGTSRALGLNWTLHCNAQIEVPDA